MVAATSVVGDGEHACPSCGFTFPCDAPRHNEFGTGSHDAKRRVKRLSFGFQMAFRIIDNGGALDYLTGLTSRTVWARVSNAYKDYRLDPPMLTGVRADLCRLQGLEILASASNRIQRKDEATQKFRFAKENRWFLAPGGREIFEAYPKVGGRGGGG